MRRLTIGLVISLTLLGQPAVALDLFTVSGTVTDPAGRPLKDVQVFYTTDETYSDSQGRYSLSFDSPGIYAITASRSDLNSQTKWVNVLTQDEPVDFQPTYHLVASVSPRVFNNDPPKTLTLRAATSAPRESCVAATISFSGAVVTLSYTSTTADGYNRFEGTYEIPSDTADGRYEARFKATECEIETLLTNEKTDAFIIDSLSPVFSDLNPADQSTVHSEAAYVVARIHDAFEVVASSIAISLDDLSTGGTTSVAIDTFDVSSGWVKSKPAELVPGREYRFEITASDYAGNVGSVTTQFSAGTPVDPPGPVTAVAPYSFAVTCVLAGLDIQLYGCEHEPTAREGLLKLAWVGNGVYRSGAAVIAQVPAPVHLEMTAETIAEGTNEQLFPGDGAQICLEVRRDVAPLFPLIAGSCGPPGAELSLSTSIPSDGNWILGVWLVAEESIHVSAWVAQVRSITYSVR